MAAVAIRAFLFVMVSVVGLGACGNSLGSPAATAPGSTVPAAGQIPAPDTPAATPVANPVPAARSPTSIPNAAGAGFDACDLLTDAELSKSLGDGVQAKAMPSSGWIAGQCAWNGRASGFFVSIGTADSFMDSGDPVVLDAKAKFAQFTHHASAAGTPTEVPGVGDGAVLAATGIAAHKGDTYLQITNLGLTEAQLIEIAKLVAAKL